jgi:predicted MFS family arabinose efflux permease
MSFIKRLANAPRELIVFAATAVVIGIAYSLVDSTVNNYLFERFSLTGFQRSFLELPRELPGFLVVFVSAALSFLCSRRLGAIAMLMGMVGTLLICFASPTYGLMIVWLFIYNMGSHLFMPIASSIGMELARAGQTGRRLGQLNALRNLATILGSFLVMLGFKYLGFTFQVTFIIAAVAFLIAALLMFSMQPQIPQSSGTFLKLHKEYRLYYLLTVLHGSRKQLFITFAPWVLVSVFKQPTQLLATLMTIGGIIGILFQPLLGWMIDHFGEKVVLASEAVLLVFVCIGYGFAGRLFPQGTAFFIICVCFLLDQMLMSVNMARSTYMKKIAKEPGHIQSALTAGVTIDHIFSISIALIGGAIWNAFGYQYVFLMGVGIAVINFIVATRIQLPAQVITVLHHPESTG